MVLIDISFLAFWVVGWSRSNSLFHVVAMRLHCLTTPFFTIISFLPGCSRFGLPRLAPICGADALPFPFPPDIEPKMFLDSESIEEWKIQRKIDENTRIDLCETLHSMYLSILL
jgi:hypothetical protein